MKRVHVYVLFAAVAGCLATVYGCGALGVGGGTDPVTGEPMVSETAQQVADAAAGAANLIFGPAAGAGVIAVWAAIKAIASKRYREHAGNALKNLASLQPAAALQSMAAAEGMVHTSAAPVASSEAPTMPPS